MSIANAEPKFRVAIMYVLSSPISMSHADDLFSGGGMGGLVLALCLKKFAQDVHFDIYESATELTEVGAGISMAPRTWTMIKELGLGDELLPTTGTQAPTGTLSPISRVCRRPTCPCPLQVLPSLSVKATKTLRLTYLSCPKVRTVYLW